MRKITLKQSVFICTLALVIGVVFYNTKDLFFGAPLSIHTVLDGATVTDAFLPISGSAKHAFGVSINGRAVAIDTNGSFTDGVVLSPGYNIIEIIGQDRFGKEKHKVFHLVAEPSSSVATNMEIHYQ